MFFIKIITIIFIIGQLSYLLWYIYKYKRTGLMTVDQGDGITRKVRGNYAKVMFFFYLIISFLLTLALFGAIGKYLLPFLLN